MGFFNKIFGINNKKDEIEKLDDKTLFTKKVQLEHKSDQILKDIERTNNQIDSLVESSKGTTQTEKKRIASRIKTLQDKKTGLESRSVAIEKQLRALDGIVNVKDGDKIHGIGITDEIDAEKMNEAHIDRRIRAQETDAKVTSITQNLSHVISSTALDEDTEGILDALNELDEGNLEPEDVKKQLSRDVE